MSERAITKAGGIEPFAELALLRGETVEGIPVIGKTVLFAEPRWNVGLGWSVSV